MQCIFTVLSKITLRWINRILLWLNKAVSIRYYASPLGDLLLQIMFVYTILGHSYWEFYLPWFLSPTPHWGAIEGKFGAGGTQSNKWLFVLLPQYCQWGHKLAQLFWKITWHRLIKLKAHIPYDLTCPPKDWPKRVFTIVLVTENKPIETPRWPSTWDQIFHKKENSYNEMNGLEHASANVFLKNQKVNILGFAGQEVKLRLFM